MDEGNPRAIFSAISTYVFMKYGLSIRSLNYDTTSKVMWGEYESEDGRIGVISITFGHSKDKRPDKNQLKIGIGTADGVIVDAKVLSVNYDDKTYNNDVLDDVPVILDKYEVAMDSFYYVADSSFFTEGNIRKAIDRRINFITRVPGTVSITQELLDKAWNHPNSYRPFTLENAQSKQVFYEIQDDVGEYRGTTLKFAVCYSHSLKERKRKTREKRAEIEQKKLEELSKQYAKREFACESDANKDIELLLHK
ncbi:MAG: IS1634 family transposase [Limnochordia bacterium]|jgi:transposase|nr:IS1634 family transposase [Limnochordia bacterium]